MKNSYTPEKTKKIRAHIKNLEGKPCGVCGNPDSRPTEWVEIQLSKDFILPFPSISLCDNCRVKIGAEFEVLMAIRKAQGPRPTAGYMSDETFEMLIDGNEKVRECMIPVNP